MKILVTVSGAAFLLYGLLTGSVSKEDINCQSLVIKMTKDD